jgi:hypothetical protein
MRPVTDVIAALSSDPECLPLVRELAELHRARRLRAVLERIQLSPAALLRRALLTVEVAVETAVAASAPDQLVAVVALRDWLADLDPRFNALDLDLTLELVMRAAAQRRQHRHAGRGRIGAPAVLLELVHQCGAFDPSTREDTRRRIESAQAAARKKGRTAVRD